MPSTPVLLQMQSQRPIRIRHFLAFETDKYWHCESLSLRYCSKQPGSHALWLSVQLLVRRRLTGMCRVFNP
jgi:hypothetical protein